VCSRTDFRPDSLPVFRPWSAKLLVAGAGRRGVRRKYYQQLLVCACLCAIWMPIENRWGRSFAKPTALGCLAQRLSGYTANIDRRASSIACSRERIWLTEFADGATLLRTQTEGRSALLAQDSILSILAIRTRTTRIWLGAPAGEMRILAASDNRRTRLIDSMPVSDYLMDSKPRARRTPRIH